MYILIILSALEGSELSLLASSEMQECSSRCLAEDFDAIIKQARTN